MRDKTSRVRLYTCDAVDLLGIIEEATHNEKVDASTEELANDWVNIILRNLNVLPIHYCDRVLSEKEHYDLLEQDDILRFEDALLHTIKPITQGDELGTPTLSHLIVDEKLEFYYHGN